MRVKELITKLQEYSGTIEGFEELNVVIETNDVSYGFTSSSPIETVYPGFDWDKGSLILKSKDPIFKERILKKK